MASTARRSVVGVPPSARGGNAEQQPRKEEEEMKEYGEADYEDNAVEQDSEATHLQKRLIQMQYLE